MSLSAVRVASKSLPATSAVIVFHGLGDSGSGWSFLAQYARQDPSFNGTRFVFPNAPVCPVSVNGGYPMPSWFDIYELGPERTKDSRKDVEGFKKSMSVVKQFVQEQIDQGIPAEKILIGGFSQGAAITLASALSMDHKLAGVMALSGFVPVTDEIKELINDVNAETPIFQGHGTSDPVIPLRMAEEGAEFVKSLGYNLKFKTYRGMEHSTCEEELVDIFGFMRDVLKL